MLHSNWLEKIAYQLGKVDSNLGWRRLGFRLTLERISFYILLNKRS
jgi:hypothetical protein